MPLGSLSEFVRDQVRRQPVGAGVALGAGRAPREIVRDSGGARGEAVMRVGTRSKGSRDLRPGAIPMPRPATGKGTPPPPQAGTVLGEVPMQVGGDQPPEWSVFSDKCHRRRVRRV